VFDFSRTFRGVNTDFFFNFSDIFLISPTSDPSDFLLNRAVRAVAEILLKVALIPIKLAIMLYMYIHVLYVIPDTLLKVLLNTNKTGHHVLRYN
jgi:hypothetical protein